MAEEARRPSRPRLKDPRFLAYQEGRRDHWDRVAHLPSARAWAGRYYHARLREIYAHNVTPGCRVLEIGCGCGDLLNYLRPSVGVGVDLSGEMVAAARRNFPHLYFLQADAHSLNLKGEFDYVILSDLVDDLWDVQLALERIRPHLHDRSRLVLNSYSRLWEPVLSLGEQLGLARPRLPQNWLTVEDLSGLLELTDYQVIRIWREILLPVRIPLVGDFFNKVLVRFWPLNHLALTNFMIARGPSSQSKAHKPARVSVIVPARNEAGNIPSVFDRTPSFPGGTELIFVEGHSQDETYRVIQSEIDRHPGTGARLIRQPGIGKGDAVRAGFAEASGDLLMILDADLSVPPEDLTRFYEALASGKGEFANGVRLVYPMESEAMRFFNLVGNKLFTMLFSWLLEQPVRDTLCGTKALWRHDYQRILQVDEDLPDLDPFGDFHLLLGAASLNLKFIEIPVRYRSRAYGETNIRRWRDGGLLLKMAFLAARRLKFV